MRYQLILLGLSIAVATAAPACAQDAGEIRTACDAFELARKSGNVEQAKHFVASDATAFNGLGREPSSVISEIQSIATSLAGKRERFEPIRVVNRQVQRVGDTAIVLEILGADLATVDKVSPRRRSLVWNRIDGAWKLVHLHESAYAPWEKSIQAFEAQDKDNPPAEGGVVFVGSSSIRGWKTLNTDFPHANAIGRGFGGSQLIDSVIYAHRIVTPYKPRAVVIYAGDNDIASGKSPGRVLDDFTELVRTIQATSEARIGYIAIKPSIRRWEMWPQMKQANALIERFAKRSTGVDYLDIATPMLGQDGKPKSELFVQDGLHLTPAGYELWVSAIEGWVNHE